MKYTHHCDLFAVVNGYVIRHICSSLNKVWVPYIYIYIYIYIYKQKANWIGYIFRRNGLLQRVIEEKIKGEIE
jgi:hypothetical protein